VLSLVRDFRTCDDETPLVLFGYLNPLYQYGLERACADAGAAGADGLLVVDLPPEEARELTDRSRPAGLDFIALFTPTSDDARVATIAEHASGFAYYVSTAGVTGGAIAGLDAVAAAVARVRAVTGLPVAVGFGIRSPADAVAVARFADAVVVGSALIAHMAAAKPVEAPFAAGEFMTTFRRALDGDDAQPTLRLVE
jgi:tryptophan synthase alpha chain